MENNQGGTLYGYRVVRAGLLEGDLEAAIQGSSMGRAEGKTCQAEGRAGAESARRWESTRVRDSVAVAERAGCSVRSNEVGGLSGTRRHTGPFKEASD